MPKQWAIGERGGRWTLGGDRSEWLAEQSILGREGSMGLGGDGGAGGCLSN